MDGSIAKKAAKVADKENRRQQTWPATDAPKLYTQTPIPMNVTNPPLVLPAGKVQPPGPLAPLAPPNHEDVVSQAGDQEDSDFRPDLSQYQLVLVRDKDVPDTSGYNPRAKLKFFPKGNLPHSSETFYLVTHRFADRAGISSEARGQLVIKSDSRGRPRHPLMAEAGARPASAATEHATGSPLSFLEVEGVHPYIVYGSVFLVVALFIAFLVDRSKHDGVH